MHSRTPAIRQSQSGFTLVELAIVLVIIGLIVGGVLVGQDLIKSAEIRATISQVEKFNAAATTFRDKFGGLPGDLSATRATQFGLTPTARTVGVAGEGNGDALVQGVDVVTATNAGVSNLGGETLMFWNDLGQADLVAHSVTTAVAAADTNGAITDLPTARMQETAVFHVYSSAGRNFFYLGGLTAGAAPAVAVAAGISPFQAFSIDEKLDNGDGDEGIVIAVGSIDPANAELVSAPCMDAAGLYDTTEASADVLSCSLAIRASF